MAPKVRSCWWAGFCLCGREHAALRRWVSAFSGVLKREVLAPDSYTRRLYDVGALVMRLSIGGVVVAWWHLSFGNQNTSVFTVLQLYPPDPATISSIRCRTALGLGLEVLVTDRSRKMHFQNLWEAAKSLNLKVPCECSAWQLHRDDMPVHDTFNPSIVAVRPVASLQPMRFWAGDGHRRIAVARGPGQRLQHRPLEDREDGDHSAEFVPMLDEEQSGNPSRDRYIVDLGPRWKPMSN